MQQVDSKIKPLISDLKETNIDSYLASSNFERLTVRHGFDSLWDYAFREAERNRRVVWLGKDHKKWDSEGALILLLDRAFKENKETFEQLVHVIFSGYINWIENEVDLEDIFSDLEILSFPEDWLNEMIDKHRSKSKEIRIREAKKLKEQDEESQNKIDFLAILETKRIEWIDKISMAKTEEAISDLKNFALEIKNDDLIGEIVNQSQRWFGLQRKVRENILDSDKEQIECNKINKALLEIINTLKNRIEK